MYPVSDVERARRFYEGSLGLKVGTAMEFAPGKWWIEYDIGPSGLGITNFAPPSGQKGPSIAIEVPDIDAALATLRAANIAVTWGPNDNDTPVCRSIGVTDPDGNELFFHQR
jgi:catechol 2,3-dioxygenase-like lactoylglutathione lyase family enzyme